jgi:hypothetical protein
MKIMSSPMPLSAGLKFAIEYIGEFENIFGYYSGAVFWQSLLKILSSGSDKNKELTRKLPVLWL